MTTLSVVVPDDIYAKLAELARRDYRSPRKQAAVVLIEAVERAAETRSRVKSEQAEAGP